MSRSTAMSNDNRMEMIWNNTETTHMTLSLTETNNQSDSSKQGKENRMGRSIMETLPQTNIFMSGPDHGVDFRCGYLALASLFLPA